MILKIKILFVFSLIVLCCSCNFNETIKTNLYRNKELKYEMISDKDSAITGLKDGNNYICMYSYYYHKRNTKDDESGKEIYIVIKDLSKISTDKIYDYNSDDFKIYVQLSGAWIGLTPTRLIGGKLKFQYITENQITIDFVDTLKAIYTYKNDSTKASKTFNSLYGKYEFNH